jgi:hypothetical protein
MVVPQSRSKLANHLLMLVVTTSACLLWGGQSARGSGCHVPDRPALAYALTWDHTPSVELYRDGHLLRHAHPAVVPARCPGEVPTLPTANTVLFAPGRQTAFHGDLPARGEMIVIRFINRQPAPLVSRLDRPPRPGNLTAS